MEQAVNQILNYGSYYDTAISSGSSTAPYDFYVFLAFLVTFFILGMQLVLAYYRFKAIHRKTTQKLGVDQVQGIMNKVL